MIGSLPNQRPTLSLLGVKMNDTTYINLKYDLTPPIDRIRALTLKFKNPICRDRVVPECHTPPEFFPPDLILTLLDSSLSVFNGLMADLNSLTYFNRDRSFTRVNKVRKIAKRMQQMCKWKKLQRFWTFTFYEDLNYAQRMVKFNSFMCTLRNTYRRLQYLGVKELHQNGGVHLHLLFDQYVPHHRVVEIWERLGCGKVVWVEFVPTDRIVAYVTKYITKSLDHGISRVVMASRGMCLYLSNWPKWLMTNLNNKNLQYVQYFLDSGDLLEYACIVGDKKREILGEVIALL